MTRDELVDKIEASINLSGLSALEKTRAMAQVLVDMGMAFEGIKETLTIDKVRQIEDEQYAVPSLGKALILQGTLMTAWTDED